MNWQPVAGPGFAEITNSRVWQTNIMECILTILQN